MKGKNSVPSTLSLTPFSLWARECWEASDPSPVNYLACPGGRHWAWPEHSGSRRPPSARPPHLQLPASPASHATQLFSTLPPSPHPLPPPPHPHNPRTTVPPTQLLSPRGQVQRPGGEAATIIPGTYIVLNCYTGSVLNTS